MADMTIKLVICIFSYSCNKAYIVSYLTWCQELVLSKTKPPKLDLGACEDKREAVELWLDQLTTGVYCQGFRDTAKPTTDPAHWKSAHHASEINAFRLRYLSMF